MGDGVYALLAETDDGVAELVDGTTIAGDRMAFAMVEKLGRVFVTDVEEGHGAQDVRVIAANHVQTRYVDHVLALVRQQRLYNMVLIDPQRGPAREKDCALQEERRYGSVVGNSLDKEQGSEVCNNERTLIRRGRPSSSHRRRSSRIRLAAVVAPSEYPSIPCQPSLA